MSETELRFECIKLAAALAREYYDAPMVLNWADEFYKWIKREQGAKTS